MTIRCATGRPSRAGTCRTPGRIQGDLLQVEPIAAALDYEATVDREQLVLVADIGGGTSDFSLVRVGPDRRLSVDRRKDILANHGVHIAGTDFDRQVELAHVLPTCGYKGLGPQGREVPNKVYFDLATWHLINTVYGPNRVAELRAMKPFYADLRHYQRLMVVVQQRLGHVLAAKAEDAKIAIADTRTTRIVLDRLERDLEIEVDEAGVIACLHADMARIAEAARHTLAIAGVAVDQLDAVYFTGGSTGLAPLRPTDRRQLPPLATRGWPSLRQRGARTGPPCATALRAGASRCSRVTPRRKAC